MARSKRSGKLLKAPSLPLQKLTKASLADTIDDGTNYSQLLFVDAHFNDLRVRHLSFDQVVFEHVGLSSQHIEHVRLLDCRLHACNLANSEWVKADCTRVELLDCHLTGFQAPEARFQDVLFKECIGHFAQYAQATFEAVCFERCDFSDANFFEADLTGVIFRNCNLSNADFAGAKLMGADLRGSQIDGIRVGPRELQGATLDPTQALAFVRSMGITVQSLDA